MEKIIKIGKQEVRLNNNVAWTMEYRDQFNKDIVPVLMPILSALSEGVASVISETGLKNIEAEEVAEAVRGRAMEILMPLYQVEFVDVIINSTWAMAKAADPEIAPPKIWVRQFDEFPLDEIAPALFEMVAKGFVSSKNLRRLKDLGRSLKNLQPSLSTKSSSQESKED